MCDLCVTYGGAVGWGRRVRTVPKPDSSQTAPRQPPNNNELQDEDGVGWGGVNGNNNNHNNEDNNKM